MLAQQYHILLAEDDPIQRELLVKQLMINNDRLEITTASNGQELFHYLSLAPYDCVVIDCNMPPLGPSDLIGAPCVKAAGCSVVAMSSVENQRVVIDSLRGGAVDFVPKHEALRGSFLWKSIRRAIARKKQTDCNRRHTERRHERLELLAHTDPLTGLPNRRSLNRRMKDKNQIETSCACIMLDIDHFKSINDQFGHAVGDAVLKKVGHFIQLVLSPGDMAFRWGGEEFLILRPSATMGEAYLWAENLRREISSASITVTEASHAIQVTSSLGVEFSPGMEISQDAIDRADRAMYLAKNAGRDRVCTWPMVAINESLLRASLLTEKSALNRRLSFIAGCEQSLGELQKKQVTEHCDGVAELAGKIGQTFTGAKFTVDHYRSAGLFHDIGKCLVPADLLEKANALTSAEKQVIDRSPFEGAQMSRLLGADAAAADAICHQRDWFTHSASDNTSNAIVSVLQVADAFVAMTTDKPYKQKRTVAEAEYELINGRGRQFNPAAVDALSRMLHGATT